MAGFVQGRNCLFKVNLTGSYLPLICAKSFSLNVVTDTVETSTQGTGLFKAFDYDSLGYTVNFDGVQKIIDTAIDPTIFDMLESQLNFIQVPFKALYIDPDGLVKQAAGTLLVTNTNLTAAISEPAGGSIEFQGTGDLVISTPSSSCDIVMTSFNVIGLGTTNVSAPPPTITIVTDTAPFTIVPIYTGGPAARFDYQVNGGGYTTTFASSWSMSLSPGLYTIDIIPYCDGGTTPGTFTSKISIVSPP